MSTTEDMQVIKSFWEKLKLEYPCQIESSVLYKLAREFGCDEALLKSSRKEFGIESKLIDRTWFSLWKTDTTLPTSQVVSLISEHIEAASADLANKKNPFEVADSESLDTVVLGVFSIPAEVLDEPPKSVTDAEDHDQLSKLFKSIQKDTTVVDSDDALTKLDFEANTSSQANLQVAEDFDTIGFGTKADPDKVFESALDESKDESEPLEPARRKISKMLIFEIFLVILFSIALVFVIYVVPGEKKETKPTTLVPIKTITQSPMSSSSLQKTLKLPNVSETLRAYTAATESSTAIQLQKVRINNSTVELEVTGKVIPKTFDSRWEIRKLKDATHILKLKNSVNESVVTTSSDSQKIQEQLVSKIAASKLPLTTSVLGTKLVVSSQAKNSEEFLSEYTKILVLLDDLRGLNLPISYDVLCIGMECSGGFEATFKMSQAPGVFKPISTAKSVVPLKASEAPKLTVK